MRVRERKRECVSYVHHDVYVLLCFERHACVFRAASQRGKSASLPVCCMCVGTLLHSHHTHTHTHTAGNAQPSTGSGRYRGRRNYRGLSSPSPPLPCSPPPHRLLSLPPLPPSLRDWSGLMRLMSIHTHVSYEEEDTCVMRVMSIHTHVYTHACEYIYTHTCVSCLYTHMSIHTHVNTHRHM